MNLFEKNFNRTLMTLIGHDYPDKKTEHICSISVIRILILFLNNKK